MTVSQKISVSLLISVVLFAGFAALAFTGLFSLVETRFYNPAVAKGLSRDVESDAASVGEFMDELQDRFSAALREGPVKRSFLPNQAAEDIFERTKLFGTLMESLPGLQSVRFVDSSGKRIHFSTLKADTLRQDRLAVTYRNYGESDGDLPYESVAASEAEEFRLVADAPRDRLVYSFPFRDSFDIYKGSALFSVSVRALTERLIIDGRLRVGEDLSLVPDPAGVVSGLPKVGREGLTSAVSLGLRDGARGLVPLARSSEGKGFALVGVETAGGFFVARVVGEDLFLFPPAMKVILLASFFLTVFLVVFLFLNLHQDSMVVAGDRIRRFQRSMLEEYYDRKEELDWDRWSRELNQRREEVRVEMKRGLGRAVKKRNEADIDSLIDKSWDELIAAVGSRVSPSPATAPTAQLDERKLQDILGRILATTPVSAARIATSAVSAGPASAAEEVEELEEVEEVQDLDEVEEVDDLDEAGELDEVEEVEEVQDMDEIEELEEVEEPADIGEPEEIEELEEDSAVPSIDDLVRSIEFSPSGSVEEPLPMPDMKVSSPFETLFSEIEPGLSVSEFIGDLEPDHDESVSVDEGDSPVTIHPETSAPYSPFFPQRALVPFFPSGGELEELAALESAEESTEEEAALLLEADDPDGGPGAFIVHKDGLAYVSDSAFRGDSGASVNRELKTLAESVIGQRR